MSLQNKHKLNSVNQTFYILEDDVLVSNIDKIGCGNTLSAWTKSDDKMIKMPIGPNFKQVVVHY
jgi:hypothetical protein